VKNAKRSKVKTIIAESLLLAVGVLFVLLVFQPFGTDDFAHPDKYQQLLGYGVLILLSYPLLRTLLDKLLAALPSPWYRTVGSVVISQLLLIIPCFLYYSFVITDQLSLAYFPSFALYALAIGLPFIGLVLYDKWLRQKADHGKTASPEPESITLHGENKDEEYHFVLNDLRYLQSQGNYVEVVFAKAEEAPQQLLIRSSLSGILAQLPADKFLQTHRSFVIHHPSFSSLSNKEGKYFVGDKAHDFQVPVSRTYLPQVRKQLQDFR
jgi:hypothetical protein